MLAWCPQEHTSLLLLYIYKIGHPAELFFFFFSFTFFPIFHDIMENQVIPWNRRMLIKSELWEESKKENQTHKRIWDQLYKSDECSWTTLKNLVLISNPNGWYPNTRCSKKKKRKSCKFVYEIAIGMRVDPFLDGKM